MKNEPLVSVLVSYYNDRAFLQNAIDSVLKSTYTNFELFLVNHATTDDCREIAHSYTDPRIVHMDMPYNITIGGTGWIVGEFLKKAKGKYIKLFCADDMLRKDGLELLVDYMENHPEKDFAFGNMNYVDENGKDLNANHFDVREGFSRDLNEVDAIRLYAKMLSVLPYPSSIAKKEIFDHLFINKALAYTFDVSLWCSLLCSGYKFGLIDKLVVDYRISKNQASSLEKQQRAFQVCGFEWHTFWNVFLLIKDIDLLKRVFPNNKYIEKVTRAEDVPFCIATEFFTYYNYQFRVAAYLCLSDLLNNDEKRQYLEEQFGYTLRNLRLGCLGIFEENTKIEEDVKDDKKELSGFKRFKTCLFQKTPKKLNIVELLFLFVRKVFISLNPIKSYRHKKKEKKQYNL